MWDLEISKIIVEEFTEKLKKSLDVDVAIVGGGPSALAASYVLSKNGFNVIIFEEKNEPGGGTWGGGMLFNELVVEEDVEWFLEELDMKYKKTKGFISIDSVHFASALLYNSTKVGTKIFNNVFVEDVLMSKERINGVVINWAPVIKQRLHVDPITVKAKYVIDGTGHPASVVNMVIDRNLSIDLPLGKIREFPMNAKEGEKFVLENTKEIFPGLLVMGMAAVSVGGGPRMGPIFGGMLKSGIKIANIIIENIDVEVKG
ncbi:MULTISPECIES: sulfide-dependent adenosine diphosphate thiazole synthase [unclassified Thermosipho (in: thermotogales)]|uniref:sulfide-dependent adenosine diphosphate thiazole synthase n=1 Tax=unclassified Thermosipho (in: thermotogales) TaxID=2676525 RepID=UPI000984EBBD|nr:MULTISPECIES: sulfide-dependent adenosine diphosphate thiazole synthase [unclassified Thermosipho (in: thermotogales)]MBT1247857.1 ribulose-1,5-biphosphate synthetase [Thermosipho sp. 1244]OOC45508.1 ribulose-1,5-biphosphate synthetase [Thermosipho sp. 1223]